MWTRILLHLPRLWARPLDRLGEYTIEEKPGSNPLPRRGLSPKALTRYWRDLLSEHQEMRIERLQSCSSNCDTASHSDWRYGSKIEMKTYEAIIELLHDIIAPTAPFICDRGCRHVKKGMSPAQLKRFGDSLDAFIEDADARVKKGGGIYPEYVQDLRSESRYVSSWRDEIWEMWKRSSGSSEVTSATPAAAETLAQDPSLAEKGLRIGDYVLLRKGEAISQEELAARVDNALKALWPRIKIEFGLR